MATPQQAKSEPANAEQPERLVAQALIRLVDRALGSSSLKVPEVYANNFQFEINACDMKIRCGLLDQSAGGPGVVRDQVFLTIPWAQAKAALYFIAANIAIHEGLDGFPVPFPEALFPPEPQPPTGPEATRPGALEMYARLKQIRDGFVEYAKAGNRGEIVAFSPRQQV